MFKQFQKRTLFERMIKMCRSNVPSPTLLHQSRYKNLSCNLINSNFITIKLRWQAIYWISHSSQEACLLSKRERSLLIWAGNLNLALSKLLIALLSNLTSCSSGVLLHVAKEEQTVEEVIKRKIWKFYFFPQSLSFQAFAHTGRNHVYALSFFEHSFKIGPLHKFLVVTHIHE